MATHRLEWICYDTRCLEPTNPYVDDVVLAEKPAEVTAFHSEAREHLRGKLLYFHRRHVPTGYVVTSSPE